MGEGMTRIVATDRKGTWVATLSEEIARMRIRLTTVLTALDRRRHNARTHAGVVAAGTLVLTALVATSVAILTVRRRRRRAHQGVTLTEGARRLGRALGRVAYEPERGAAQPSPPRLGIPPETVAALLTAAQILGETVRERRRRNEVAARHDGMRPNRATGVASAPAPDESRLPQWSSP